MSDTFKIEGVPYFSQRDNQFKDKGVNVASVSCFPTSMAMAMAYTLSTVGKTKKDVGCAESMQLEDYINQVISSAEILKWEKENVKKLGSWIWSFKPRTIYAVEAQVFNMLMNQHGFKATDRYDLNYNAICDLLEKNKLPFVIGGNFSSVSKVQGHMNCLIGFNKIGMKEVIVHDPWGNALNRYYPTIEGIHVGNDRQYGIKFFIKGKAETFYAIVIEKI